MVQPTAMVFNGTSTAGTAQIVLGQQVDTNMGFNAGFLFFRGTSTADQATITTRDSSNTEFQESSTAGHATLIADPRGSIFFENESSADNATITMLPGSSELSFAPGFFGGGTATAGNATIINSSRTNFFQGSSAGTATITTESGGVTSFFGESTGGSAAFIANAGGIVDFSGLGTFPDTGAPDDTTITGTTAGSIAGAGAYFLGSKQALTVGSNNLSTVVNGVIGRRRPSWRGRRLALVKVGTGTLTLSKWPTPIQA